MPYEEYTELIGTCSNAIMNHHRQQGAGNIVVMLFLGANVYLNRINPYYSYLKEKGAVVFTVEELSDSPELLDSRLSKDEIEQNRQILMSSSNEKATLDKTERLINKVLCSKPRAFTD